jgi:hypothetical protein
VNKTASLKKTTILTGYHCSNYRYPYEALAGKTPSEACGITIKGENKWKTLIQNATRGKKCNVILQFSLWFHPYQNKSYIPVPK